MNHSNDLLARANHVIPGGVNSPVRSFRGVGGNPIFIARGEGAYLYDVDGKKYVDYIGSWGPLIVGHAHPKVVTALKHVIENGSSFGAPTEQEVLLAEKICQLIPSIEMVRMVSSGTEATLSALRLARGYTKRDKIIKFNGCYHGHCDSLLVKAGSGGLTFGTPDSAGVPEHVAADTLVAEFNDLKAVENLLRAHPNKVAAIIVEPIAGNMNMVLPNPDFLPGLRHLCDDHGCLLIFDEVMTGFRVALGGAQALFQVKPDLTTLGKVIGGGLPVGAFGGRRDIMVNLAPLGPVYQAGTLSGNPLAMTAGLATLELISSPDFYPNLQKLTEKIVQGLVELAENNGHPALAINKGGMFGFYFTKLKNIHHLADVMQSDGEKYKKFFHAMLRAGVYFAPSPFEAGFVSSQHGQHEIDLTLSAAQEVLRNIH